MKLNQVYEINKDDASEILVHLVYSSSLEDAYIDLIWEGYLSDCPVDYFSYDVVSIGRSLKDCENGINGYYLYIDVL